MNHPTFCPILLQSIPCLLKEMLIQVENDMHQVETTEGFAHWLIHSLRVTILFTCLIKSSVCQNDAWKKVNFITPTINKFSLFKFFLLSPRLLPAGPHVLHKNLQPECCLAGMEFFALLERWRR